MKLCWDFVGELSRKDIVKPKPNIFTFFSCSTVGQLFVGMNRSDLRYGYNHFNKKEGEGGGRQGMGL